MRLLLAGAVLLAASHGHALPDAALLDRRQGPSVTAEDSLLQRYSLEIKALLHRLSAAKACYDADGCDDEYDAVRHLLDKARQTASDPSFPHGRLQDAGLPDLLDEPTLPKNAALVSQFDQLRNAARLAYQAYEKSKLPVRQVQRYSKLAKQLYQEVSRASQCYTDYERKVRNGTADPGAIESCHQNYDRARSLLDKARRMADKVDFPKDNQLYHAKLPDVRDGRTSGQGDETQKLGRRLQDLAHVLKKALVVKQQGERLRKYRPQLNSLVNHIAEATKFYGAVSDKIKNKGLESEEDVSAAIKTCADDYGAARSTLGEVRKTAAESGFPGGDVLSQFELADLGEGQGRGHEDRTQAVRARLDELEQAKAATSEATREDIVHVRNLNETIVRDVGSAVNQTVVETLLAGMRYAALRKAKERAKDQDVLKAAKEFQAKLLDGLPDQAGSIAENALKQFPEL